MGSHHVKPKCPRGARARRPRARICLRKGCGHKYQPRRWNQRYCQDPQCLREVRRWQAARRQAKRRQDAAVQSQHAKAQQARRRRVPSPAQPQEKTEVAPARGHAAKIFWPIPLCARPGCHAAPLDSIRTPARYCCAACRQAVRNVVDRERKWRWRGTLSGRRKRAYEYRAARARRARGQPDASAAAPSGPPPQ